MKYNLNRNLTKNELKYIRLISKGKKFELTKDVCRTLDILHMHGFITCSCDMEGLSDYETAELTEKGQSYLEEKTTDNKRYKSNEIKSWIAIFISVCALIVSIIALIQK